MAQEIAINHPQWIGMQLSYRYLPGNLRPASIHDEQSGAVGRITPVGLHAVADLIAHSRSKHLHAAVFQFGVKFTFQTQKYVTFLTPVIREIARRIINHSDANIAELPGAPVRYAVFSRMRGGFYRCPVSRLEKNIRNAHWLLRRFATASA